MAYKNDDQLKKQEAAANRRVDLHEQIPLDTPFSIQFTPSGFCNFKCTYCWQSLPEDILRQKLTKRYLDVALYEHIIDGCKGFSQPTKMILFAGAGEPLMHKQIDHLVSYAKHSGVTERVDILTNAALLTHDVTDRLLDAGLDRLRISLQGLSTNKYKEMCGVRVDFDKLVDNITYFHTQRTKTSIYIKIIDCALGEDDEADFTRIFSPISDDCAVEYLSPFVREIDYSTLQTGFKGTFRNNGVPGGSKACPLPFYMLSVQANGDAAPWCTADVATVYGNAAAQTLPDIWHSEPVRDFWRLQLTDRSNNPICRHCQVPDYNVRNGDCLNGHEEAILARLPALSL